MLTETLCSKHYVNLSKGVKQGCGLSLLLFNVYTEEAMKEFSTISTYIVIINSKLYKAMCFADDML